MEASCEDECDQNDWNERLNQQLKVRISHSHALLIEHLR